MPATDVQREHGRNTRAPARQAARVRRWLGRLGSPRLRALLVRIRDRYPELPPPLEGMRARVGMATVVLMTLAYVVFFTLFLWSQHDAYLTHAEDMGIMDQALWNTGHGAVMRQTICNIVGDTNCFGGVSRLGIHFEPIMFPLALLYLLAPSPKMLQLVQTLIVATGALPAYWIASRRLRSALAGVVFAAIYLLYPALQSAVTYDFHAVTLAAAFLMFALYFMLTRNDRWLIVFCVLALATKESIVVDVGMIGLSIALLQRRTRLGLGLVGVCGVWLAVELAVLHAFSPLGHSPTASRYAYLGSSPLQAALTLLTHPVSVIRDHVLDPGGAFYLRTLLAPAAYLPLLSPLTLLIAVPALAINLLSSDAGMRLGLDQYNADIVPVLVFAAIESVAMLAAVAGWLASHARPALSRVRLPEVDIHSALARLGSLGWWRGMGGALRRVSAARVVMYALTALVLVFGLHEQQSHGYTPIDPTFQWPQVTAHTRIADELITLIPPDAVVSAQSDLVPHISHRRTIYLYPYKALESDYIFLDVTGNLYPYYTQPPSYFQSVTQLLDTHAFHVVAARDGYLLLARGAAPASGSSASANPGDPYGLPASFYSFAHAPAGQPIPNPVDVAFGSSLDLLGYSIAPAGPVYTNTYITITTYWRTETPLSGSYAPELLVDYPDGSTLTVDDFATQQWLPPQRWQPGQTMVMRTWPIFIQGSGTMTLSMRVFGPTGGGSTAALLATLYPTGGAAGNGSGTSGAGRFTPVLLDGGTRVVFADRAVK